MRRVDRTGNAIVNALNKTYKNELLAGRGEPYKGTLKRQGFSEVAEYNSLMNRKFAAIFIITTFATVCSCGNNQAAPETATFQIEQPARPEPNADDQAPEKPAQTQIAAEQPQSRAEQVMKALFKAYPKQIESVEFRDNDWALRMRGTWYYYAGAKLLPENLRENAAKYRAMLFYWYSAKLPEWVAPSPGDSAQLGKIVTEGSRDTRRRSDFLDDLWQMHNSNEAYGNIRTISFLGRSARVHHLIVEKLSLVEERILTAAKSDPQLQAWINSISITESWSWRNIADTQSRSYHSYGLAVDLLPKALGNKQTYWLWTAQQRKDWWNVSYDGRYHPPDAVISAFETFGFIWGGKWFRFDTMHFEYRPELLVINPEFS